MRARTHTHSSHLLLGAVRFNCISACARTRICMLSRVVFHSLWSRTGFAPNMGIFTLRILETGWLLACVNAIVPTAQKWRNQQRSTNKTAHAQHLNEAFWLSLTDKRKTLTITMLHGSDAIKTTHTFCVFPLYLQTTFRTHGVALSLSMSLSWRCLFGDKRGACIVCVCARFG